MCYKIQIQVLRDHIKKGIWPSQGAIGLIKPCIKKRGEMWGLIKVLSIYTYIRMHLYTNGKFIFQSENWNTHILELVYIIVHTKLVEQRETLNFQLYS